MTITIELTPEEERQLREKAERQGQAPEGVVHSLVRNGLFPSPMTLRPQTLVSDKAHEALVQRLLDAGLMAERPMRPLGPPPPLITVRGRPVSETIVEERR